MSRLLASISNLLEYNPIFKTVRRPRTQKRTRARGRVSARIAARGHMYRTVGGPTAPGLQLAAQVFHEAGLLQLFLQHCCEYHAVLERAELQVAEARRMAKHAALAGLIT